MKDNYRVTIDKGDKFRNDLKDTLKGSTLTSGALYRCGAAILGNGIWKYKKETQRQHDDKHLTVFRNTAKSHQKRLQNYHGLISNKKNQDRSLYTSHVGPRFCKPISLYYGGKLSGYDRILAL